MNEVKQIILTDGDGDLHDDGLPRLIMAEIIYTDGKRKRFPYAVAELPGLFGKLGNVKSQFVETLDIPQHHPNVPSITPDMLKTEKTAEQPFDGTFLPGDIVKCVKVNNRDVAFKGERWIEEGKEYRIIQDEEGLCMVDDTAPSPRRAYPEPDEIEFVRRPPKVAPRGTVAPETTIVCHTCGQDVCCSKRGQDYVGWCCTTEYHVLLGLCSCGTKEKPSPVELFKDYEGHYSGACKICQKLNTKDL